MAVGLVLLMAALAAPTAEAGCANLPRSGWHKQYSLNFTNNDYQRYFRLQYSWNDHNPAGQQRHFPLGRVGKPALLYTITSILTVFAARKQAEGQGCTSRCCPTTCPTRRTATRTPGRNCASRVPSTVSLHRSRQSSMP